MGLLDTIYSAGDSAKRYVKGLLGDPVGTVQQNLLNYADQLRQMGEQNKQVLADPLNAPQSAVSGLLNAAVPAITVWHGTPHKFAPTAKNPLGEFDLGKIGTGEGAQAYGHGVYVAENPEVAQSYQGFGNWAARGNGKNPPVMFKGKPVEFNKMGNAVGDIPADLKMFMSRVSSKGTYDAALAEAKTALADMKASGSFPDVQRQLESEISAAIKHKMDIQGHGQTGTLYKVDLPDEHLSRFLDWDKPLADQSEIVRNAYAKAVANGDPIAGDLVGSMASPSEFVNAGLFPKSKGSQAYETFSANLNNVGVNSNPTAEQYAKASQALRQQGLLGIRYLDQGSRDAGAGSSNFVVFQPDILRILERQ